jgi:hypothetical protein
MKRKPKPSEKYVRVNVSLRADDAKFLAAFAYREAVRLWADDSFVLHRGERVGASMAIRLLIDAERKRAK